MRLDTPLDDILASRGHIRVLRSLFRLPAGLSVSGREIARLARVSHPRAGEILESLCDQEIVIPERTRHATLYQLNRAHVLVGQMAPLFEREEGLASEVQRFLSGEIARLRLPVTDALLFGSAARGEMEKHSDIDLALICATEDVPRVEEEGFALVDSVRERFGSVLSMIVASPSLASLQRSRPFWRRVANEGIPLPRNAGAL